MNDDTMARSGIAAPGLEESAASFFEAALAAAAAGREVVEHATDTNRLLLRLPPLGEGDRGMVYRIAEHDLALGADAGDLCLKVAKPQPVCRERLLEEARTTAFFLEQGVRVPRIHHMDPLGRFCVKEYVEGESVTSLYLRFAGLTPRTQRLVLEGLRGFLDRLLELFRTRPDCKVSISPNNIYVLTQAGRFSDPLELVLIDPGTTLKKNYDGFTFERYWNEVLPDRIDKYRRTGYLQWLVPHAVTQSERDEVKDFEIFRGLKPSEVFLLLKAARTLEFDAEEVILREGAVGENFYLVLEGEVEARRGPFARPGAGAYRIGTGSVLGEMAFLLHVPRSMTVVAATPCKLVEIRRDTFDQLLEANLAAPFKLIRNVATTLAERLYALGQAHDELLRRDEDAPVETSAAVPWEA